MRRCCTRSRSAPGLFHGLGELEEERRERLLPLSARLRQRRGRGRRGGPSRWRASTRSPPSTSTRWRRTRWCATSAATGSRCGRPASTRSWSAPRSPTCSACALNSVRVIVPYLGGGFGSKSYTKMEPITAALARHAGRPVRIQNSVAESMVTTRRHGMRAWMRTRAKADGTLLSREVRFDLDTGAYADNGPRVCATAGDAAPGPYRWQAVRVDGNCVYTCTSPAGSYRAFGACHLQWIGESQVDEVARRAGVDPLELRRRNLLRPGRARAPDGRQAARRRPRGRRREGRRGDRLGRAGPAGSGPRRLGRPAGGRRTSGLARVGAAGPGRRRRGQRRAPPRWARARAR